MLWPTGSKMDCVLYYIRSFVLFCFPINQIMASSIYRFASLFTAFILAGCQVAPPPTAAESSADKVAILKVINMQVNAWNDGDIDAFMQTYWQSDSLRFASGGNVRQGWDETMARYKTAYPDRAAMGTLNFEDLDIKQLSREWAVVFGRYRLKREAPLSNATGLFTLLLENKADHWIIVHDHTSAAE